MKKYLLTMGGTEFGWSRLNDEGIHRDYSAEAQRLIASGNIWGLDGIEFDNNYILNSEYNQSHPDTLSKAGFGFAFKPIIFWEMLKKIDDGDLLLFVDSNHVVAKDPSPFYEVLDEHDIFSWDHIWTYYPNKDWTKRDTFISMGCDEERYWNAPQMHCCITGIKKSPIGMSFAKEYLDFCLDWRVGFGEEKNLNFPSFKENRHNQSIFSILREKYSIPYVNRTQNVWLEYVIPEIDYIAPADIIDNSYRMEQDRKDIR